MKIVKYFILSFFIFSILLIGSIFIPFPKSRLQPAPVISLRILDREGRLLREVLSDEEGRCRWVKLNQISPYLISATLIAEDKNFFFHPGIDLKAILRAIYLNIKAGRVVSGGSTLTQQLVKNIYHFPRNWLWKIVEVWFALRLERNISKEEILTQYFNRVYYGNQAFGIEAASQLYFDKPAAHLALAEAAFLTSIPRSPSLLDPYRHYSLVRKNQFKILEKMLQEKIIKEKEYQQAVTQPLNLVSKQSRFLAPHFCEFVLSQIPFQERRKLSVIQTTLDYSLQKEVELLLKTHIESLKKCGVTNGAAVIIDNFTGEILSMVGSVDFFNPLIDGQVNGCLALRQPGSALKPFTYGLALEKGMTPAEVLPDIEFHFNSSRGDFIPQNYDRKFHGPVRLRTALACSYNVPAVWVLNKISPELLLHRLHQAGFQNLTQKADYYGLGLTLGNGEVTLLELVRAYSALARGGIFKRGKIFLRVIDSQGKEKLWSESDDQFSIFSPQISYLLTNILSDRNARIPAFGYNSPLNLPFPCTAKTGTSKDFRDNWTVGYTPKYTVGVWVGNFNGKPMHNVSGVTGCGPIFRDIMFLLEKVGTGGEFEIPSGLIKVSVCPDSGKLPNSYCPTQIKGIFIQGTEPKETCDFHQLIKVDKRTGFPAREDSPEESVIDKVVLFYPPLYYSWAYQQGMFFPKSEINSLKLRSENSEFVFISSELKTSSHRSEPSDQPAGTAGRQNWKLVILFPDDGDIFKIDPVLRKEYQTIIFKASVPSEVQTIDWWVDEKYFGESLFPFNIRWTLQPGTHKIKTTARMQNEIIESNKVKIVVLS
ncbi:MAG: penicillin-binding protein 1C [Candidatus Aminicenantia bacterium]